VKRRLPREAGVQPSEKPPEVDVGLVDLRELLGAPERALVVYGKQVGVLEPERQPVLSGLNGGDEVEAEQGEVGQVVACERLALEVRVDEAQAAQAGLPRAGPADVRELEPRGVPDDDARDVSLAVEEDTDLAVDLA
jgi:hypothetical protein